MTPDHPRDRSQALAVDGETEHHHESFGVPVA